MPRRRQPPSAISFAAGVLAATLALAGQGLLEWQALGGRAANAQAASPGGAGDDADRLLMRPQLDGNPQNPPRFRSPRQGLDNAPTRFGQLPNFDYRPALGAGTTGFDSTNARKRKPRAGAKPAAPPRDGTTAPADAADAAAAAAAPASSRAALTPKQRQKATGPIPGRVLLQNRPGVPPADADAEPVTFANLPPYRRPLPDEKPYDPLGVQAGAFIFRPAFEYTRGFDNNAPRNATPPAQSSWYNVYAPELLVNSNWDRHEFTASLRGTYTTYDTMHSLDRPNIDAKIDGRIDVTRNTRIDLEARYLLFTDYLGSPNIQTDLAHLPIGQDYGATAGIGQSFNRLDVSLKGSFDRITYNDSEFLGGATSSNADRNYNRYGTVLRTSYEVMPGAKPFIELGADERAYDLPVDAGGENRTSQGYSLKVGTTFDFVGKLTGEISGGYLTRLYHDPTLPNINGWAVDSSLVWLATALTTVKLINTTNVTESTQFGVSGEFTRETTLQVDHAFRRWLVFTLKFTRGYDQYVGSGRDDIRYIASTALAYNISRELWLRGEYRNETRSSNQPGNNYFAHVWLMTLRLQR